MGYSIECGGCSNRFNPNNHEVCPKCKVRPERGGEYPLAAESSVEPNDVEREGGFRVSTVTIKSGGFPITTSNYVPGKDATEVVGIVFSSSNRRMGLSTTNLASNTFKDAYQDIKIKAKKMGADAVISLSISIERAGPSALAFSQTVTLMGTAVKLKQR